MNKHSIPTKVYEGCNPESVHSSKQAPDQTAHLLQVILIK